MLDKERRISLKMLGPEAHSEVNVVYSSPLIRIRRGSERLLSYLNNLRVGCSQFYRRLVSACPSKWIAANGKVSMSVGSNITGNNF